VLDEFYWLNKDDPNFSLQRQTQDQGKDAPGKEQFGLSDKAQKEMLSMFLATREEMENKRIDEVLGRISSPATSGSTGAPCSPSRNGIRRWR
jgi:oleate hydratase